MGSVNELAGLAATCGLFVTDQDTNPRPPALTVMVAYGTATGICADGKYGIRPLQ